MNDYGMHFPGKPSWLWCFLLFKCKWEVFDNCPSHKQKTAVIKYWSEEYWFRSLALVFIGWQEGGAEPTCPQLTCVISPGRLWRCTSKGAAATRLHVLQPLTQFLIWNAGQKRCFLRCSRSRMGGLVSCIKHNVALSKWLFRLSDSSPVKSFS